MAYADLTPAQRQNLSRLAHIAATETHRAREDFGVHGKDTARIFLGNAYVSIDDVLTALAAALPAGTPDPLTATVANGGNVNVKNSAGTVTKVGVATVAASAITGVALAATEAIVSNAGAVVVQNSAGTAVAGTHSATVAAGVVSNVKLAATIAPVTSGLLTPVATGTGTKVTLTVAGGVVTAVALSA